MIARALGAIALAGCIAEPARPACAPAREITEISSAAQEFSPFLTSDRLEIYFASSRDGNYNVYRAARRSVDAPFDPPARLTSAGMDTFDPALSTDGNTLWYLQGDGNTGGQIMEAHRDAGGFSGDHPVFTNLGNVLHPTFTDDGLWIYYAVSQTDVATNHDLYRAHRATASDEFGPPEALAVNTPNDEEAPAISADGSRLLYGTNVVPGGPMGQHAVEVSTRDFANPTLLAGLQPGDGTEEDLGALHPDGRTIVYVSSAAGPSFDVWIYCE